MLEIDLGKLLFQRDQARYPDITSYGVHSLEEIRELYAGQIPYPDVCVTDVDGVLTRTIGDKLLRRSFPGGSLLEQQWADIVSQSGTVIVCSSRFHRTGQTSGVTAFPFFNDGDPAKIADLCGKTYGRDFFMVPKGLFRHGGAVKNIRAVIAEHKSTKPDTTVHAIGSSPVDFGMAQKIGVNVFFSTQHILI